MSKIEVNAIEPQCGTTLTVGASGDTITFPSGTTIVNNGSQTGFGRTGTVDWQTAIKTSTITAVNGEGYFVNTSGGAITANLPAGVVGAIVSFKDYAQTFDTNALTISANASEKIEGLTFDLILDTKGQATTLVYGDATKGWQSVNSNEVINQQLFVAASGGTETTSGDFKIHTFTGPGTFTVSCAGNAAGSSTVDYMVVAGGGGGGSEHGGGGGAGGFRESSGVASGCYTASPLGACVSALPVLVTGYPITVGGGGAGGINPFPGVPGTDGNPSVFSTITSTKGGYGTGGNPNPSGNPGGSAGGGSGNAAPSRSGGTGNTPPVSPPQGNDGGNGNPANNGGGGGGGGATVAGGNANPAARAGAGGAGATTSISASPTTYAGGGGGGSNGNVGGLAGPGGGGAGAPGIGVGSNGTTNTGGGAGGGGACYGNGGTGGSGIVIIRYNFQ